MIKGNKLCQSGPYDSERINDIKINQADQVIKGRELTETYSFDDGGVFKVRFCCYYIVKSHILIKMIKSKGNITLHIVYNIYFLAQCK